MREEDYLFALSLIPHIGYKRLKLLLSYFGAPSFAWEGLKEGDVNIRGFGEKLVNSIKESISHINIEKELEKVYKKGIKIITIQSPEYPYLLKKTSSPPIVLYFLGDLPDGNYISVVGTRRPSQYGILMAERFASDLARRGIVVVSGMARGIDTYAHISAIKSHGKTIAVLGTGVDVVYPPENKRLYKRILENGAVISEYPPGTGPKRENFPRRNRIISGISLGTLVVEAPERSGSLITANFALEEGREVFAVPGQVDSKRFKGTNQLIKRGAKLVEDVNDIIEEFPYIDWSYSYNNIEELNEKETIVYNLIGDTPKHIDEIKVESKLSGGDLFSTILKLEIKGFIKEIGGKIYCRIK